MAGSDRSASAAPASGKVRCPGCGSLSYSSDAVCMTCGRELERPALHAAPAEPPGRHAECQPNRPGRVNGAVVLALGCLSLLLGHYWIYGFLLGPVAWVLGNKAVAAMDGDDGLRTERSEAQIGRICGMISTGFLALVLMLVVSLLGLGSLFRGASTPAVPKNAPAPAFRLADLSGREQTLNDYRGRIVLLNFFASW